jgi:hypothetical protein
MVYTQADLDMANRHIAEGENHIVDQERVVNRLVAVGVSTEAAESLLSEFNHTLKKHREHRDRVAEGLQLAGKI